MRAQGLEHGTDDHSGLVFADGDETISCPWIHRGPGEEFEIKVGEVETVLGEVRQTLNLVSHDLHEF